MEKFIDIIDALINSDRVTAVIAGIVTGVVFAFVVIIIVNLVRYIKDKLNWNNGICKACGEPWEFVGLTDSNDEVVQLYDCCNGHKLFTSSNFKGTKLRIKSFKVANFHNPVFRDFLLNYNIEIKNVKGGSFHISEGLAHPEELVTDTYTVYKDGNKTAETTGHTYRVSSLTGIRSLLRHRSEINIRYDLKELLDSGTFKPFKE